MEDDDLEASTSAFLRVGIQLLVMAERVMWETFVYSVGGDVNWNWRGTYNMS